MDIKDSYLHGTVGVVKSISVAADKLTYNLADVNNTAKTITLPLVTQTANGLMSKEDKTKLDLSTGMTQAIPYIVGPDTDTTAGTWTGSYAGITAYTEGLTIIYVPAVSGASTTTLNINNLGAKTCCYTGTAKLTTHYAVGTPILFTYSGGAWRRADYYLNTYASAYCNTAAATSAKTASCYNYTLKANSYIHILIQYSNTVAGAITLTINNTGAKPIYINGTASSASNYTLPAGTYIVYYDGTNFYFRTDGILPGTIEKAQLSNLVTCTAGSGDTYRPIVVYNNNTGKIHHNTTITANYNTGDLKATSFTGTFFTASRATPSTASNIKSDTLGWFNVLNSSGYAGDNTGFPTVSNANGILWLGSHFNDIDSTKVGYGHLLGFSSNGKVYHRSINNGSFPTTANGGSWKEIAYTNSNITGNAASADKLKNSRKLWGLDFDGTADVKGTITIGGETSNKAIIFPGSEYFDGSGNFYLNGTNDVTNSFNIFKTNTDGTKTYLFNLSESKRAEFYGTVIAPTFQGNIDGSYVNVLTGYTKATAIDSIATTDSLNTALGKLEFKTDFIYNDLFGTDNDTVINKWHEIVDFIDSVAENTDITDEFVTRKTELNVTGKKTFIHGDGTYFRNGNNGVRLIGRDGYGYLLLGLIAGDGTKTHKGMITGIYAETLSELEIRSVSSTFKGVVKATKVQVEQTTSPSLVVVKNNNGTISLQTDSNRGIYDHTSSTWLIASTLAKNTYLNVGNVGVGIASPTQKLHVSGNVLATSFITSGGVSSLFVKGDGSLDSNTYATTTSLENYVTLNTNLTITGKKTFEGSGADLLTIKRTNNSNPTWIRFYKNDHLLGYIGVNDSEDPVFLKEGGDLLKLLHSGNTYINSDTITINGKSITPITVHQSLANYVTLDTDQTITGVKTFSSLLKFTVAAGTAPFLVTSNTIVSNLNAEFLNGISESKFFRLRGAIDLSYVDLKDTSAGATDFKKINPGIYSINRPTCIDLFISFATNSGSVSSLELKTSYSRSDKIYVRKAVDSNRISGAWRALAYDDAIPNTITIGNSVKNVKDNTDILFNLHDILLGSTIITSATSWDITNPGVYRVLSSSTFTGDGNPEAANGGLSPYRYGQLIVSRAGDAGLAQFYISHTDSVNSNKTSIKYRTGFDSTYVNSWDSILDSSNYMKYTVTKDGTGATGTWGIDITGSAAKLTTVSKKAWGLTYWTSGGVPTDISGDIYSAGNIWIPAGSTNKYITFTSSSNNSDGIHSWRIGYLGTGNTNENYLVFLSIGASGDSWSNALRFECGTRNAGFGGNVYPLVTNSKTLGTSELKWSNVYATTFTGNLTGNVTGNVTGNATTATTLKPITLSLSNSGAFSLSSSSWTDTGYTFTSLATGTYAIQITSESNLVASGIMSVYKNLEDSAGDEIPLHVYSTAGWRPYLRTYANKLLISSNDATTTSRTVTIKIALIL